jgi:4-alpha-glucanotransferase
MFFTDFFQMSQTYNTPGTSGDKNWSLRLPENFAQMETINLPLLLKKAILARGSEFANANKELIEELNEIQ